MPKYRNDKPSALMEYLALEIFDLDKSGGSKFAYLPEDASITITDTSEIFASGDVWSYPFTLNTYANSHIFGTSGEVHGARLHEQINKRRARLWIEDQPVYFGYLKLSDEVDVDADGNIEVSFESGQKTFEDMINGAKANQVPMMSDVRIGVALWRKREVEAHIRLYAAATFSDGSTGGADVSYYSTTPGTIIELRSNDETAPVQQYPRMVYPKGVLTANDGSGNVSIDEINTDFPYTEDDKGTPTHPYCNIAFCYQKYGYEKTMEDGTVVEDYDSGPEAQRGYEYMPANRVNSAPNFYVIYWIRALMKHLGIHVEENQMLDIEDLRRLFFVNTNCAYYEPKKKLDKSKSVQWYKFRSDNRLLAEKIDFYKNTHIDESGFTITSMEAEDATWDNHLNFDASEIPTVEKITAKIKDILVESKQAERYVNNNSYLHDAYATSDCFPNAEISEVIRAIENGFGVRFLFDGNFKKVRIVLLRNIFQNHDTQTISCDVISINKQENGIRGFRMTYGNTDDTHFYYKGFADMLPHKQELWVDNSDDHDYSHWSLNADYAAVMHKVSAFDKTCYVTPENGNAYGIKVDKDAKRYDELHPSLFEYAGFMDAEDGDCTGEDSTIETINVGFTPAIVNDLNMEAERNGETRQQFAIFVDSTMRPRRPDLRTGIDYNDPNAYYDTDKLYDEIGVNMKHDGIVVPGEFTVTSDMFAGLSNLKANVQTSISKWVWDYDGDILVSTNVSQNVTFSIDGHINEGYRLYLQDNFEPNDDGVSPIETHDWGLTLGVMRGSGSDAYVKYEDDLNDDENDTWEVVAGSSATTHPDTCNSYGEEWDYDGGTYISDSGDAISQMEKMWPKSNISLIYRAHGSTRNGETYLSSFVYPEVKDKNGQRVWLLMASAVGPSHTDLFVKGGFNINPGVYAKKFEGMTREQMYAFDAETWDGDGLGVLVEIGSSFSYIKDRAKTLGDLQKVAFLYNVPGSYRIDPNGIGSRYGRFSLKLRAEKPNPYFKSGEEESKDNSRYLEITNENLCRRGLADQFYKEYSYWMRNARIAKIITRMELTQLLSLEKTKRIPIGDITGFIRKIQYSVSNKTGLGNVTMEIMYI